MSRAGEKQDYDEEELVASLTRFAAQDHEAVGAREARSVQVTIDSRDCIMVKFSELYTRSTEFSVESGDFSALEIRDGNDDGFCYFFDTKSNRLITDFAIEDRDQVATLCQVTVIKKSGEYSPRIRLWKKDKTKPAKKTPVEHVVPETEVTKIIKASVDAGSAHENFWKLIHFLQSLTQLSLPDNDFRVVTSDSAQLAKSFEGKDKQTILEAVRAAIGGELTEEDIRLVSNRKVQLNMFDKLLNDDAFFESERARFPTKDGKPRRCEDVWQRFFEANSWIFGYGLKLVACEPLDEKKMERNHNWCEHLYWCGQTQRRSHAFQGIYQQPGIL